MAEKKNEVVEQAQKSADMVVNNAFVDALSVQLKEKEKYGLTYPPDYNPTNALMGAYLMLKETNDKNNKCVLQSCSQPSIANSLMDMVTMGLSAQKKQCYFIGYGGKLQCQVSYHGNKAMAHRYGAKEINAEVIYDGDTFEYHIENGRKILDKHIQDFRNINLEKIVGAYCVVKLTDGSIYMDVMNISQIKTAWKKGYGYKENSGTHKEFTDMMAKKTITSRVCKQIVQQYGDVFTQDAFEQAESSRDDDIVTENKNYDIEQNANSIDFDEDFDDADVVDETPDSKEEEIPDFMKED